MSVQYMPCVRRRAGHAVGVMAGEEELPWDKMLEMARMVVCAWALNEEEADPERV